MSLCALNDVWSHSKASGNSLLVLLAITDSGTDGNLYYPDLGEIDRKSRLKRREVKKILRELQKLGELVLSASILPATRLLRDKGQNQPVRDGVRRADRCDDNNDFCQVVVTAARAGLVTDRKTAHRMATFPDRMRSHSESLNVPFRVVWLSHRMRLNS